MRWYAAMTIDMFILVLSRVLAMEYVALAAGSAESHAPKALDSQRLLAIPQAGMSSIEDVVNFMGFLKPS